MTISISQLRAARAIAGLTLDEVRSRTGISKGALSAIETGKADPRLSTVRKLQELFEELGIEFLPPGNGAGPGVRLKKPEPT
jgi:transcriptional regulator with XRE-family HTH domain